jgi:hypothetical protein
MRPRGRSGLLNFQRFFSSLIFRPHRTFSRELLDLRFAALLVQCSHEFLVAPLLRHITLAPEFFVLHIDVADESRRIVDFSPQGP